jgi:hypothetical protein
VSEGEQKSRGAARLGFFDLQPSSIETQPAVLASDTIGVWVFIGSPLCTVKQAKRRDLWVELFVAPRFDRAKRFNRQDLL